MVSRDYVPGLSGRLRVAREAAGLTQAAAAKKSGVHAINIAKFETGAATPTVRVLMKLAKAYGVTTCDLIPDSPGRPAKRRKK